MNGDGGCRFWQPVQADSQLDPEIDRVDRSSRSFDDGVSRVDWPVKSRVDRSSRSYVFEVEPVDFQYL